MMKKKIRSLSDFFRMLFNSIYKILMATRIKDWEVPYTWWIGIEITENHVINVLLRELNNLIHVNEDRELYVDLQLDDWIQPDDDFPVGITTGRILAEDWRPQNWLIINRKTTSGDYTRLITAADGNFYVDLWDWVWRLLGWWGWGGQLDCNTKTFWISNDQDFTNAQAAYDWYMSWKNSILIGEWDWWLQMFYLSSDWMLNDTHNLDFAWAEEVFVGNSETRVKAPTIQLQAEDWVVQNIYFQYWREYGFIDPDATYTTPFIATESYHPTTKQYVDDGLALKQDKIIAWNNITIDADWKTINAVVPSALVYKWNVNWIADLPSSWQSVWDTYFVEWADAMYSWDWTQWNYVWGTWISLNDYFNKTIDDSDDITEGSLNLFVSPTEKATWNAKQDALTAGANITIDSNNVISAVDTKYTAWSGIAISNANVISNTAEFDPQNAGSLGQFLKKTNDGYAWADIPWGWGTTYTEWDWIDITNNVISNTAPFEPTNQWSTGQVLKKSGANSYYRANESWWEWNFNPENTWTTGQVLTKTATGYDWETIAWGEWNVKLFPLNSTSDTQNAQDILDWALAWKMPIIKFNVGYKDVYYCLESHNTNPSSLAFSVYLAPWQSSSGYKYQLYDIININYSWTTVTNITHNQEELNKTWIGTQAQYDLLTPETWVIYNIIPSS